MEPDNQSPGMLIARLDRIPIWSLPGLFIGIIASAFFLLSMIFSTSTSHSSRHAPKLSHTAHRHLRQTISACQFFLILSAMSSVP